MKLTYNQLETLRKLKHGALPMSYRSGRTVVPRQAVRKLMALGLVKYTNAYCAGLTDAGLAALVAEGAKNGRQMDERAA